MDKITYEGATEIAKKLGYSNLGLYPNMDQLNSSNTRLTNQILKKTTGLTALQFEKYNDLLHQKGLEYANAYLNKPNDVEAVRNPYRKETPYRCV